LRAGVEQGPRRQPVTLAGNETFSLSGTFPAWHVKSGSLALFAVETGNGASGHRQFLFRVGDGEILFSVAPIDPERTLIAVPADVSTVVPLVASDLEAHAEYIQGIEKWCASVARVLSAFEVPEDAKPMPLPAADGAVVGKALYWLDPQPGWVRVLSGSASLVGLGADICAGCIVPMAPGIWLGAPQPFEVERVSGETAWGELRMETMQALSAVLLRASREIEPRKQSEARLRVEQRRQLERRMGAAALVDLAGATERPSALPESPLLSAARMVAESLGLELRAPVNPSPREHSVAAIANASGFRTRLVLLGGDWWRRDNGPLLGYRIEDKSPVALIPRRRPAGGSGYDLIDPLDVSTAPLDRETAASLDLRAFSFYRQFGASTALFDLARFALRPYKRDLATVVFSSVAASLLGMVVPAANSVLFGQAIPDADRSLIWQVILGMAIAFLGSALFNLAQSIAMVRIQSGMSIALQCGIWDRLLRLSPAFFRKFSVGDLWIRTDAVDRIRRQLTLGALTAIFTGIASLFNIALMLYYSVPLAAIACLAGLVILASTAAVARKLYRLESASQELEGFLSGFVVQLVNSVGKLRVAGAERRAFARWGASYGHKQRITLQTRRLRDGIHILNTTLPAVATALTLAWIAPRADGPAALPIGTYLAFAASFGVFMSGVVNLSETIAGLSAATVWKRAKPILDESPEVRDTKAHPGRLSGRIQFEHVDFRYGGGPLTLEDINIAVEPGECVALVGPSGGGKSTILNLLLQFEAPSSGAVYVDGQDLSSLDISAVRRQFGVVNQDSKLASQSIFENIVGGSLCTLNDAWDAARAAAVADDIEAMPMGMHTVVSEGGTNLSGGQRQRILIARALVQKPALLILDEATSALDNRTQRSVAESLGQLKTTRVVVAHRLSTIKNADRIYVIDSGRVVQHGTYQELSVTPGPFLQLVSKQMGR
jgi:NHLM bacteriocin system ABC transporter ATP-binding protein